MKILEDKNVVGRVAAVALLIGAGFLVHRINCGGAMCPLMKTDACCTGEAAAPKGAMDAMRQAAPAAEAPKPARRKAAAPAPSASPEDAPHH